MTFKELATKLFFHFASLLVAFPLQASGQKTLYSNDDEIVKPRIRVIIDNDFGGDPDGLFQLAHQLLSSSTDVRAIICSHHYKEFYGYSGKVDEARKQVKELLKIMHKEGIPVYLGSDSSFVSPQRPLYSEGAQAIIHEAMRDDPRPLYVVCGAALTNMASAYLLRPAISKRIKAVVWIGGVEYANLCNSMRQNKREYNQSIDPVSSQVVFNYSDLNIWQIPRNVYRQALYSHAELKRKLATSGPTGHYLMDRLDDLLRRAKGKLGECYVLGDSPLVLVTSLQTPWEQDAASCEYAISRTPFINASGFYEDNPQGRPIRIFTRVDTRLIIDDLEAKLSGR
jgi:inosine-uridine nucleoside N-ribohydrolase